jgi:hypothetical protein
MSYAEHVTIGLCVCFLLLAWAARIGRDLWP